MTNSEIRRITRKIAATGMTNMFDVPVVIQIAETMGYNEYAHWVHANKSAYGAMVLTGKLSDDDEDGGDE